MKNLTHKLEHRHRVNQFAQNGILIRLWMKKGEPVFQEKNQFEN